MPVGALYMHGKVERKIRHVKESFSKHLFKERLSVIQWETLGDQIANSINNLPIAIGNVTHQNHNERTKRRTNWGTRGCRYPPHW